MIARGRYTSLQAGSKEIDFGFLVRGGVSLAKFAPDHVGMQGVAQSSFLNSPNP